MQTIDIIRIILDLDFYYITYSNTNWSESSLGVPISNLQELLTSSLEEAQ